jgi:hypothetical protein
VTALGFAFACYLLQGAVLTLAWISQRRSTTRH